MPLLNAKENLKEFASELGMENLEFDQNNTCILGIDDKFSMHITYEPKSDRLYLYSPLLDGFPTDKDILIQLYEELLTGSMLGGKMAGGGVGIARKEELILMHCYLDMHEQVTSSALRNFAPLYVETIEKWREKCADICGVPIIKNIKKKGIPKKDVESDIYDNFEDILEKDPKLKPNKQKFVEKDKTKVDLSRSFFKTDVQKNSFLIGLRDNKKINFSLNSKVTNIEEKEKYGYMALGVSLDEIYSILKKAVKNGNKEVIKNIGMQINYDYNVATHVMFDQNLLCLSEHTKLELDTKYKMLTFHESELNTIIDKYGKESKIDDANIEKLINYYIDKNQDKINTLMKFQSNFMESKQELDSFVNSAEISENFLDHLLKMKCDRMYIAYAWTQLLDKSIRIWKQNSGKNIFLMLEYISIKEPDVVPIDIMQDLNGTNYERLKIESTSLPLTDKPGLSFEKQ